VSNDFKKVGSAWLRTSRDGEKKYISCVINGGLSPDINLVMFLNSYKESDKQPDYVIYLSRPKDAPSQTKPAAGGVEFPEPDASSSAPDDEIPF